METTERTVTAATFELSRTLRSDHIRVTVPLARPLVEHGSFDSPFETFACAAINAGQVGGDLPAELEPYRGWLIRDVMPA